MPSVSAALVVVSLFHKCKKMAPDLSMYNQGGHLYLPESFPSVMPMTVEAMQI